MYDFVDSADLVGCANLVEIGDLVGSVLRVVFKAPPSVFHEIAAMLKILKHCLVKNL